MTDKNVYLDLYTSIFMRMQYQPHAVEEHIESTFASYSRSELDEIKREMEFCIADRDAALRHHRYIDEAARRAGLFVEFDDATFFTTLASRIK